MSDTASDIFPQTFFVEGKYLGQAMRPLVLHMGAYAPPLSFAYFCPVCAELWARCPVAGSEWMVWTRPCRKHPPQYSSIPGSLWLPWEKSFNDAFTPELLAWELDRHLDYADHQQLQGTL